MKFSYTEVWNDTVAMLRANAAVLAALAGVFYLLPDLAFLHFFPPPEASSGADPREVIRIALEYYGVSWPWLLLEFLIRLIGAISMLLVLLGPRTSVGGAIASSVIILPFYFVASLVSTLMVFVGLLLIVPGLYLIGRVALAGPVVVVEGKRDPVAAIARSFALTKGNGWAVALLFALVVLTAYVLITVAVWLLGGILILAAGKEVGSFLALVLRTLGGAVFSTVMIALTASLYRTLKGDSASAA